MADFLFLSQRVDQEDMVFDYAGEIVQNEFLMGYEDKLDYNFNLDDDEDVNRATQELIDYWYERWLKKRLTTVDIKDRLEAFRESSIMLGNY